MSGLVIKEFSDALGRQLRQRRTAVMREHLVHEAIAAALAELGIVAQREYRLDEASRLDFFIAATGTAIEAKKTPAGLAVMAQIGRYFESEAVRDCVLVAPRIDPAVPAHFRGKPIHRLPLWKFLL